jgi:hypothetical protein
METGRMNWAARRRDERQPVFRRPGLRFKHGRGGRAFEKDAGRLLAALWFFLAFPAGGMWTEATASALEIVATVDKTEATVEDQILLTVSVSGARSLPEPPELPPLPDFDVAQGGTSSQTRILNGEIESSVSFTYVLSPRRPGDFTIGPIRIRKKNETAQSEPIRLRILPAARQGTAAEAPAAFVEQQVDVQSPYVNQPVLYSFRFLRRVQAVEAQWEPPPFDGFWVEDLGKERQYQRVLNGQSYLVTEIRKVLYPLSPGILEIPSNGLTCKLVIPRSRSGRPGDFFGDDFFENPFFSGREAVTKVLKPDPIRLEVKPLPEAGRPPDFSGLVGAFRLSAEIGQARLKVGDSTTLTVTVTGRGNLRDLANVPPDEIGGCKIYPDKPSLEWKATEEGLTGTKVFKKALVPLQAGELEIPAATLSYFDPYEHAYRTAHADPLILMVEKAAESEDLHWTQGPSQRTGGAPVRLIGKDILPIHTGLAGAGSQVPDRGDLWVYLLCGLAPPAVFGICLGLKVRRERIEENAHVLRRKAAGRTAAKALDQAKKIMKQPAKEAEYYGRLSRALKGLVGDKLNVSALACTPEEIARSLLAQGVDEGLARSVRTFLEELEQLQFGAVREEAADREKRFRRAKELVKRMDRSL